MLDNISLEEKSYLIGFLQGDGTIAETPKHGGKISIQLSSRDKDILDKIEDLFSSVYVGRYDKVYDTNFKKGFSGSTLSVYDEGVRKELKLYIPVGKKSDIIKPPIDEFDRYSYIRGLTDADGAIGITSKNRPFWSLCTSSEDIKDFIIGNIMVVLDFDKRLNRNKRDNVYNIVLYDEDAVTYTKLLYDNSTIHLDRKYNEYNRVQSWVRNIPKRPGRKKSWLGYEDIIVLNSELSLREKCVLLKRTPSSIKTRLWRLKQK